MHDHSPAPQAHVDLDALARRIAARAGLPIAAADIERVMAALLSASNFWEVVALADRPAGQVAETLIHLAAEELAQVGEAVALTPAGTALGWQRGLVPRKRFRCPHCAGRGLALEVFRRVQPRWERVRAALGEDGAPTAERLSPDAVLGLVAFLADRGDLMGKAVLVLGDPSLVSVALALSGFPRRVVLLEEDPGRAQALADVAGRQRMALEVRGLAGDEPLPTDLRGAFSTLVLGRNGGAEENAHQVQRGLAGLRGPGCGVVYGLATARVPLPRWADLERQLLERAPLALTDLLRDALEYERHPEPAGALPPDFAPAHASSPGAWYRAALLRWETLPGFDPTVLSAVN
ncbi:MAG: bis-aminopropyl spermidine synthase family protein [Chloroflexi bacterium]|nr:bis-aminopropyl spermidine synthase family protein [Chloroflexota bacterium]